MVVVIIDWWWDRENSYTYYGQGVMETSMNTIGFPIHDSSSRYTWPEQAGPRSCFFILTHHQSHLGPPEGFWVPSRRFSSGILYFSKVFKMILVINYVWKSLLWSPEKLRNLPKEQLVQRCLLTQTYLDGLVYFMSVSSEIILFQLKMSLLFLPL